MKGQSLKGNAGRVLDFMGVRNSSGVALIRCEGTVNAGRSDVPTLASFGWVVSCGSGGFYPSCWPAFLEKGLIPAEEGEDENEPAGGGGGERPAGGGNSL